MKKQPFIPYAKPPVVNLNNVISNISLEASKIAQEMLYDAEDYMAMYNIIIFLYLVEKRFGNLKTVQKGMKNLLNDYNDIADAVDEMGLKEAYERLHEKYGIELLFNDFDINKILDEKEIEKQLRMRITLGEKK